VTRAALICLAGLVLLASSASAQPLDLQLTVSPRTITFASANPDTSPTVAAAPISVTVRVKGPNTVQWHLSLLADGDLVSGASTIPISNVTWTATQAPPFQDGTLSRTTAQTVAGGSGTLNPGKTSTLTFSLVNSWLYDAGTYTQTLTFTLSSP
jgi:hypothetical protein